LFGCSKKRNNITDKNFSSYEIVGLIIARTQDSAVFQVYYSQERQSKLLSQRTFNGTYTHKYANSRPDYFGQPTPVKLFVVPLIFLKSRILNRLSLSSLFIFIIGIECFNAIRAYAMAKISFRIIGNIGFHLIPSPLFISDFFT